MADAPEGEEHARARHRPHDLADLAEVLVGVLTEDPEEVQRAESRHGRSHAEVRHHAAEAEAPAAPQDPEPVPAAAERAAPRSERRGTRPRPGRRHRAPEQEVPEVEPPAETLAAPSGEGADGEAHAGREGGRASPGPGSDRDPPRAGGLGGPEDLALILFLLEWSQGRPF
jgi:hypothetical protein